MLALGNAFGAVAAELALTPAQLALAWLLHQGPHIVPIPGTRRVSNLEANAAAAGVSLDDGTLRRLDELLPVGAISAERYPAGSIERVGL
jgi:aryl-alcohol dehydrogenase-like predicted oxidoreductase